MPLILGYREDAHCCSLHNIGTTILLLSGDALFPYRRFIVIIILCIHLLANRCLGALYHNCITLTYRIAGKFGGELNLVVWRYALKPPN